MLRKRPSRELPRVNMAILCIEFRKRAENYIYNI